MPLYVWVCKTCSMQVELLRSFDENRRAPEDAELGPAAACGAAGTHAWDKLILAPNVAFGESWGGGPQKGKH